MWPTHKYFFSVDCAQFVHGPPLTTKHGNEEDHLVSETLTEDSEAGALLLLHGKMLFLTHSAKGNPLGIRYDEDSTRATAKQAQAATLIFASRCRKIRKNKVQDHMMV